jgi:hypothetical protein
MSVAFLNIPARNLHDAYIKKQFVNINALRNQLRDLYGVNSTFCRAVKI